jgi:uncharacterized protein
MNGIIDFHTHAFPDNLAEKAVTFLEGEGGIPASLDGRISSLLDSMDRCGIEKSLVCSIATKPSQFTSILHWSETVSSDRIIPLPSIHPDDPEFVERIKMVKEKGFKGIKMHPYYQNFILNEKRVLPIYEEICKQNLMLVLHTGFDFAFERIRKADPEKFISVKNTFPDLKIVATHLGAWDDWSEVERLMVGKNIYMEISYSLDFLDKKRARDIIMQHPKEYILFGTDSPWTDQMRTLNLFKALSLGPRMEDRILRENALSLLSSIK